MTSSGRACASLTTEQTTCTVAPLVAAAVILNAVDVPEHASRFVSVPLSAMVYPAPTGMPPIWNATNGHPASGRRIGPGSLWALSRTTLPDAFRTCQFN